MGIDINNEVAKASAVMTRYRMRKDDQIEVVRILLGAGVEHCLQEQERLKLERESLIEHAQNHPIYRGWN